MKQAVIGLVPTTMQADALMVLLRATGIKDSDISVVMPDFIASRDLGHEKHSKAPEGASAGAGTGLVIGGALGWLAGMGAVSLPGLGPLLAAGPILAALSGAAVGGAAGGLIGTLIGLGIPEYEARQYEGKLRDGNILVSVHTEDYQTAKAVREILKAGGVQDATCTAETPVKRL